MQLAEFIKSSLLGIAQGIRDANAALEETEGEGYRFIMEPPIGDRQKSPTVEFDVAVTGSSSTAGRAGAGIQVAVVGAALGWGMRRSEERVSRIQFKVQVNEPLV